MVQTFNADHELSVRIAWCHWFCVTCTELNQRQWLIPLFYQPYSGHISPTFLLMTLQTFMRLPMFSSAVSHILLTPHLIS